MSTDKPKNVISVTDLDDIEENPDPVRIALKGGKFITFPDIFDMPIAEAEAFFYEMNRGMGNAIVTPTLQRWLAKDDYEALMSAYPTLRKLRPVIERVMAKYEAQWGTEGEGSASTA